MFTLKNVFYKKTFFVSVTVLFSILLALMFYSSEWGRLALIQHYLNKKDYMSAEELCTKIIRKRKVSGKFDREFKEKIFELWKTSMKEFMEQQMVAAKKEWNSSRSCLAINRILFSKINPKFKKIIILEPALLEDLNAWMRNNNSISSIMPYSIETGMAENDVNPESGPLRLNCSGGFALDYKLRSIGANLGIKKPVAAVRLRHEEMETRVKPENLSLWISDDNEIYRQYTGRVTFSNEIQAMFFDHLNFSCKYLKIHCDIKDDKYTFAEDFKKIIETYGPSDFSQIK